MALLTLAWLSSLSLLQPDRLAMAAAMIMLVTMMFFMAFLKKLIGAGARGRLARRLVAVGQRLQEADQVADVGVGHRRRAAGLAAVERHLGVDVAAIRRR